MKRLIDITYQDIEMGDRGCENSCPIALALKREYDTENIGVTMEDNIPILWMDNEVLKLEDDMLKRVDKFIENFDRGGEDFPMTPEPFTLEVVE
tara:strand:- start:275 stop:556 length:282 start_codon:yes stop_codon:yes gene_type:complete